MRREAATDAGPHGQAPKLGARRGGRPGTSGRGSADHAEKRPYRQLHPQLQPGVQLPPSLIVHSDLAALASLAVADQERAASRLEVTLR